MLQVIDSGRQAVLLAPTEVLAAQHARSVRDVLGPLGRGGELGAPPEATAITLLTGSLGSAARKQALLTIASGQAGIIVGTHALLSEGVFFANLGLVVIDEQHRFGVEQRHALRTRHPDGNPPHVLVMTATPIPRTVAMTVYGDLDTSTLSDLPHGRSPISTTVVPAAERPGWLDRGWTRVREEVGTGHQVYVVCPKIGDDGETPDDGADLVDEDGDSCAPAAAVGARGRRQPARGPARGSAARRAARPAPGRREGRRDAAFRRRRHRRAGRHDGDRGRRRCAERDDDGDHGRGAVRHVAAAPAARPGRPGQRPGRLPARHGGRARTPPDAPG